MSTNLTTTNYKFLNGTLLQADIANTYNTYYMFASDHLNHSNTTLQPISNDIYDSYMYPWQQMLFGVQITAAAVSPLISNYVYNSNTVFSMYDNLDTNLINEQFFTITSEGSFYHVWKVLDNNNKSPSVVIPLFADISSNSNFIQTSDGYRWKYMSSTSSTNNSLFASANYFPLSSNSTVVGQAVPGAIDIILVANQGSYYNNYVTGNFLTTDIKINGDSTLYNISNTSVVATSGFYTGCILYITTGLGAGQYSTITSFTSNNSGNIIRIANSFLTTPQNGDAYQIYPQVLIQSTDNQQTINCVARALVNAYSTNSIYRVEVLNRGAYYRNASANIVANAVVGITANTTATLRPIIPPPGGHGSNPYTELYCNSFVVSVAFNNSIGNTVPAVNQYQQYGIIKNPLFANVVLTLANTNGQFVTNEIVSIVNPTQVQANVTTTLGSNTLTCNTANFTNQFAANTLVYLSDNTGLFSQLAVTGAAANSVVLKITTNALFSCTSAKVWQPNLQTNASVITITNNTVLAISNTLGLVQTGSVIVGQTSGTTAIVGSVSRNNQTKMFNTFVQLYKYIVTVTSGTFVQNEILQQVSGAVTAGLQSFTGTSSLTMLLSNFNNGYFSIGDSIFGQTSGAIGTVTAFYQQELVYQSGSILYVENINPVTRQPNQTENLNVVFNF